MKRLVAWLGEKPLTRAEILLALAAVSAVQYFGRAAVMTALGWITLALLAFLAVVFGWTLWDLKWRRK